MNLETIARRVRAEFEEMPGLMLTVEQASRLFGLDQSMCRAIVDHLVGASYLRWTRGGAIARDW